jgi:ABC-2 type transport system ATP-binding protein
VCTRAIVIARGRIVADAKPAELEARSSYHNAVALRLPADQVGRAQQVVGAVPGVARVEDGRAGTELGELIAFPNPGAEILDPVCRAIDDAGLAVNEVFVERGRLDEVFRQLTQVA